MLACFQLRTYRSSGIVRMLHKILPTWWVSTGNKRGQKAGFQSRLIDFHDPDKHNGIA